MSIESDIEVGQYHYSKHYLRWRVWKCTEKSNDSAAYTTVAIFDTREEARKLTYELNGWKNYKPKAI